MVVRCRNQATLDSLRSWFQQHSTSLENLKECSVTSNTIMRRYMRTLPCRQLRKLHLEGVKVQFGPAGGHPGVLQHCTGLKALSMQGCQVPNVADTVAAIAALPQLQSLGLGWIRRGQDTWLFGELCSTAVLLQLTHLSLYCSSGGGYIGWFGWLEQQQQQQHLGRLSQLSALVNLAHLELKGLPDAWPGGLPSQLVKLTCLDVQYIVRRNTSEQLQHLSSFTALQQLSVQEPSGSMGGLSGLSGIQHLSQLTSLALRGSGLEFGNSSSQNWTQLTALQSLTLTYCQVQPEAFSQFTQLQALDLQHVVVRDASLFGVVVAVSQLPLLTSLIFSVSPGSSGPPAAPAPAAALTALTASTNMCSLLVGYISEQHDWVLFTQGPVYPKLRRVDLKCCGYGVRVSEQQLQQLCISCPALEDLQLIACQNPSPTAWQPLTQLSALTRLVVYEIGEAVAAVADAAAQLTGLKQLQLWNLTQSTHPQKLTSLTALEEVTLDAGIFGRGRFSLQSKPRFCNPADVWRKLRRYLK